MHIVLDARMYGAKQTSGIGLYVQRLTEQLFELDTKNRYTLLLNKAGRDIFQAARAGVNVVPADFGWYSYAEQINIPLILKKIKYDVYHCPHFNLPLLVNRNAVVTIHDLTPKFFPGPRVRHSLIRKIGYETTVRHALAASKKIIAVSDFTKEMITAHYPKVAPKKITVIQQGIDSWYQPVTDVTRRENVKKKYGITDGFILYVGVWRDHKNIETLVGAYEQLPTHLWQRYQLVLAGRPDKNYPEIQKRVSGSRVRNRIITPGFIDQKDLPALYSEAAVFVLPSFIEGFGLVAGEAAACGTPVIASETSAVTEVLGDAAFYFNPHDPTTLRRKIELVLTSPDQLQAMVAQSRLAIAKFTWRRTAQDTLGLYQSVASR
ncbi:MAG: hypothetical protein A2840_00300 [Candidatus Buchananbacteria bacterium RIFCSPHIGHO2_01_FULL_47_11b]|uniref:Glycosyl transferase family 1 domain-containing protein n=1 Tax=Candidatus Buchananbacteria bacterium RIFCSPHIGHO2_01_FULL_47_11b TaxID=1797537 RepID=A0A1G1Y467_9BACT|nr:MAG: hypothetical protein A2840_00300 [Candidatus Buchananbacteria bacterium RIFCSPHIGHO2_01_FULL_47_11b]